jgi:hypothetical protein
MSAFIVDKAHIDALVDVAVNGPKGHYPNWSAYWYHQGKSTDARDNPDDTGRMLWATNFDSVAYRYDSETDLPGPIGINEPEVMAYSFKRRPLNARLTPVAALKALDGYEYQSCEHPEWQDSKAHAFCTMLRSRLIGVLPGYDEADTWSIAS